MPLLQLLGGFGVGPVGVELQGVRPSRRQVIPRHYIQLGTYFASNLKMSASACGRLRFFSAHLRARVAQLRKG